jgi:hypothetical protein
MVLSYVTFLLSLTLDNQELPVFTKVAENALS